jgi:hypothetical protein
MPYSDPEKKREANRRWFEARGGAAAEMRARRARMTDEQREAERARDRARRRVPPGSRGGEQT